MVILCYAVDSYYLGYLSVCWLSLILCLLVRGIMKKQSSLRGDKTLLNHCWDRHAGSFTCFMKFIGFSVHSNQSYLLNCSFFISLLLIFKTSGFRHKNRFFSSLISSKRFQHRKQTVISPEEDASGHHYHKTLLWLPSITPEVLNASFASVFNSKTSCSPATQPAELEDREGEQNEAPIIQGEMVSNLLHHLDTLESMGLGKIHPRYWGSWWKWSPAVLANCGGPIWLEVRKCDAHLQEGPEVAGRVHVATPLLPLLPFRASSCCRGVPRASSPGQRVCLRHLKVPQLAAAWAGASNWRTSLGVVGPREVVESPSLKVLKNR